MSKKPISIDKIHSTLKEFVEKVDEAYNICFARQFEGSETERSWAKADKARYDWLSDKLWEIIYQCEEWQQI